MCPTHEQVGTAVVLATLLQEQYTTGLQEQPPTTCVPPPAPAESANMVCNAGRGNFSPSTTAKSFGSISGCSAGCACGRSFG